MSNFIDYHGKRIGTSSSKQLIEKSYLDYMALPTADKLDPTKEYFVDDASELSGLIVDSVVSETDTWSSNKINNELNLRQISNPNLLDNPWFTVNQRGQNQYTDNWVYTIDRWIKGEDYTLNVGANGIYASSITLSYGYGHLSQRLDNYNYFVGKICTLSVLKSTGEIVSATGVVLSGEGVSMSLEDSDIWCGLVKDVYYEYIGVNIKNTTVTIRAIKLELGSISTLHLDTAPNYATELLKCQRYFVTYPNSPHPLNLVGVSYETGGIFNLPLPCAMRTTPTITVLNAGIMYDANGTQLTRTGSYVDAINVNNLRLYLGVSEILPNFRYVSVDLLELNISADL